MRSGLENSASAISDTLLNPRRRDHGKQKSKRVRRTGRLLAKTNVAAQLNASVPNGQVTAGGIRMQGSLYAE